MTTHLRDIPDITARRKAMLDELVENGRGEDSCYEGKCALGRWLPDELCRLLDALDDSRVWKIAHLLPPWMQEMDWRFLAEVQAIHDQLPHWEPRDGHKRLSSHGETWVEFVRTQWGLE